MRLMKKRTIIKILLWSAGILIVIAGTLFAIGYFYYGKIIKISHYNS